MSKQIFNLNLSPIGYTSWLTSAIWILTISIIGKYRYAINQERRKKEIAERRTNTSIDQFDVLEDLYGKQSDEETSKLMGFDNNIIDHKAEAYTTLQFRGILICELMTTDPTTAKSITDLDINSQKKAFEWLIKQDITEYTEQAKQTADANNISVKELDNIRTQMNVNKGTALMTDLPEIKSFFDSMDCKNTDPEALFNNGNMPIKTKMRIVEKACAGVGQHWAKQSAQSICNIGGEDVRTNVILAVDDFNQAKQLQQEYEDDLNQQITFEIDRGWPYTFVEDQQKIAEAQRVRNMAYYMR